MFILQVKYRSQWKWGRNTYETREAADARVQELAKVGIKARVKLAAELFG